MKFAIFGTGGVGGYFGGRLAHAGKDVTFIARGKHLASITESGLKVDSIGGDFLVKPAKATDSPQSVGEVDVVIVATKAWQLPDSINQMKPLVGDRTMVLPLLNGIEHIELLKDAFGERRILGGFCRISSFVAEPGHITHVGVKPFISFGELNHEESTRVRNLKDIFSRLDEIDVEVPADIHAAMWGKFILICSTSGVGAVTRLPFGVIRDIPESRAMLRSSIDETVRVGQAKNINLAANLSDTIMERIDNFPKTMVASMQKDIIERRPSELEAQTGAVIRMGREVGVPTPTHEFIYASLLPMEIQARGK
jgi:2-dehydropantoate 2-reductase